MPRTLPTGWAVALLATAALAALAAAPPLVGGEAGRVLHGAFSFVCHQLPDRSPHLGGGPTALCHRCWGMLLGLAVGLALSPGLGAARLEALARGRRQGLWLALAAVPTGLDWALGAAGVWANTAASRLGTGAVVGLMAGAVLAANLLAPPRRALSPTPAS